METQLQGVDSPNEREMPYAAAVRATQRDDPKSASRHRSGVLQSAIRILTEAGRALGSNKDEAQVCIAKATALLQAESDIMDMSVGPSASNRLPLAPWQVTRVIGFIEGNLSSKIGVRDLAAVVRLSSSHFARAFRATVGQTPYAYLIRRRIELAQRLILRTDKPLAQIALDCGFGDQAHIARLFRRLVGVSPGAWRRTHGTN
jgi:AraC family transcriptional regulator